MYVCVVCMSVCFSLFVPSDVCMFIFNFHILSRSHYVVRNHVKYTLWLYQFQRSFTAYDSLATDDVTI